LIKPLAAGFVERGGGVGFLPGDDWAMRRKRLIWRLYPWFLAIAVAVVAVVAVYSSVTLRRFYLRQTADDLEARIEMVKDEFIPLLAAGDYSRIEDLCRRLEQMSGTRMTIILTSDRKSTRLNSSH
jgi:two-component system phosphate regulon sensor histidine kinase PhoR